MYTQEARQALLESIVEFVKCQPVFEGLLLIGSGVQGFTDVYSDIDLMAACTLPKEAEILLCRFFEEKGAFYIDHRQWSDSVLGLSAYFEQGLSVDLSFMPGEQIPLRTRQWSCLVSKSKDFDALMEAKSRNISERKEAFSQHRFFYALRCMEIALRRGDLIYAEKMLSDARNQLLLFEVQKEGKKTHQFKAYHQLETSFLEKAAGTYPIGLGGAELKKAQKNLLALMEEIVGEIDEIQRKIWSCFE